MRVTYSGPHAAVEVPDAGIVAERDKPVDVLDSVGKKLVKQEFWTEADEKKPAAKTDKDGK